MKVSVAVLVEEPETRAGRTTHVCDFVVEP